MLTGTPLDLTPFGSVLQGVGILYWLLAALGLWWALRGQRPWKQKVWRALPVALIFGYLPGHAAWQAYGARKKFDAALAHFEMRCKSVGEKVTRAVENVDGVVWMKWRDKPDPRDDYDQFKLSDPYGRDCNAEGCIEQLLRLDEGKGRFGAEIERRKGRYRFVESIDPGNGQHYRYTGTMEPVPSWTPEAIEKFRREKGTDIPDYSYRFALDRRAIEKYAVRYGITWDDISTREDREQWVAGGSIKVIDLQTNEVIAERIGYMMDRGLGSTAGFRSPWGYALRSACPSFPSDGTHSTRSWPHTETFNFVSKVVKPTRGE